MEAKTAANNEIQPRPEDAKPSAVLSLRQIQDDVALQKKYAKAQLRLAAARTFMSALMLVTLAAFLFVGVPRVQTALARLDAAMDQLESIDLNALGKSMEVLEQQGSGLADAAAEKLDTALVQFNAMLASMKNIDIDALNQSITDFAAILEPLKDFIG
ncbi:MAG TPA: hypothetical protein PKB13_05920 [Clostridia bacterium]|nr:hypothetical protein [Clostridia bacterium]